MSRPEFLHCPMTSGVIRGIRERQQEYDKDPQAWERREKERHEERQREEWEERNQ